MTIWWSPTSASYTLHCKFSERGSRLPKEGQWQNRWVFRNIFTQDVVWEVINASQLQPSWRRTWKKWGRKKRKSCKQSPNLPSNSTIWKRKTGSENLKQLVIYNIASLCHFIDTMTVSFSIHTRKFWQEKFWYDLWNLLHRYICHIRDSSTTQSKHSVCDIFSSRQQDAVIMRHFNYSPDKYMVSISNTYSLTIIWMIQINSKNSMLIFRPNDFPE